MAREGRGGNAGRASSAAPAATAPVRKGRRYGAVTATTPLSTDLSFDHVAASEQGYCSLPSRAEEPLSSGAGGGGGFAQVMRRVVVGGVVITLFAAAVSTLYDGRASSESAVSGVLYPKMAAEVSAFGCPPAARRICVLL